MTEEVEVITDDETLETPAGEDLAAVVAQIIAFVAATAGTVFLTRKIMNRFDRKRNDLPPPTIEVASTEV